MTTASNRPDAVAAQVNCLEQKVAYLEGGGAGIDPDEYARVRDIVIDKADQTVGRSSGNVTYPGDGLDRAEFENVFSTYGGSLFNAMFGPPTASYAPYSLAAGYLLGTQFYSFYEEYRARITGNGAYDTELDTKSLAERVLDLEAAIEDLDDRVSALESA